MSHYTGPHVADSQHFTVLCNLGANAKASAKSKTTKLRPNRKPCLPVLYEAASSARLSHPIAADQQQLCATASKQARLQAKASRKSSHHRSSPQRQSLRSELSIRPPPVRQQVPEHSCLASAIAGKHCIPASAPQFLSTNSHDLDQQLNCCAYSRRQITCIESNSLAIAGAAQWQTMEACLRLICRVSTASSQTTGEDTTFSPKALNERAQPICTPNQAVHRPYDCTNIVHSLI